MRNKKCILSAVLAVFITFGMVLCVRAENAPFAAASKVKVTFNGTTITFNSASEPKTIKSLEKKWGKKTETNENDFSI